MTIPLEEMERQVDLLESRGELDIDSDRLYGLLQRDEVLKTVLARVLRLSKNMMERLLSLDPHEQAAEMAKVQGLVLGLRLAVDTTIRMAYEQEDDDA